jgi:hypothetical protein
MTECDFNQASLTDVLFEQCELREATFSGVKLKRIELRGCDLAGPPPLAVSRRTDRSRHGFGAAEAGLRSGVERTGIEPVTSGLQSQRSPS